MPNYPANGSADGITGLSGEVTATGPGVAAASVTAGAALTAKINVATTVLSGAQSATDKTRQDTIWSLQGIRQGTNLPNNSITVLQPFTDGKSLYVLPAGTLTANRVMSIGNTGQPGAGAYYECWIVRLDTSAFTYTVQNTANVNIHVFPASPPVPMAVCFVCQNGIWTVNLARYVNG